MKLHIWLRYTNAPLEREITDLKDIEGMLTTIGLQRIERVMLMELEVTELCLAIQDAEKQLLKTTRET